VKDRIKKHVDNLFTDIYETKQLRELKEEISANVLEKIHDLIASGYSADAAFQKAVSDLGDMSELIGSLKKASEAKVSENMFKPVPIDKKHIIGYVTASVSLLLGLMFAGFVYLQQKELPTALAYLMPFVLVSAPLFIYFGLTQETQQDYGMTSKRALTYSVASEIFLFGAVASGIEYFQGQNLAIIFLTLMPFIIVSAIIFIYLGLTEKSRRKMDSQWQQQWVNYYSDPQTAMVRGSISGALWIFSIGAFLFIGFTWGWKYSWIVFVLALGCEPLIEAYFASKKKKQ
jgi:hypothetical protein